MSGVSTHAFFNERTTIETIKSLVKPAINCLANVLSACVGGNGFRLHQCEWQTTASMRVCRTRMGRTTSTTGTCAKPRFMSTNRGS